MADLVKLEAGTGQIRNLADLPVASFPVDLFASWPPNDLSPQLAR